MAMKFIQASGRNFRFCGLTSLVVAGIFAAAPVYADTAAVAGCKRTADEKSVYMRALQTNLMVAALTCNSSEQYNNFIHQFQTVLIKDSKQLQAYYKKRHGRAGASELNAFITHLANDESQRSIQEGSAQYCDESGKLFTAVLALPTDQVEDFSTMQISLSADAPVKPCAGAKTQTAAVAAPVPAAVTAPAPASVTTPVPADPDSSK
jgi:hypothetical protein